MATTLTQYADIATPRYTSYPTAPHFKDGFSAKTYSGWLGALDPDEPISLYVHIPYCTEMCWYCGCNMKLAKRNRPLIDYVDGLVDEVTLVAAALPARMKVAHLHLGGGTPTALPPAEMSRLFARLRSAFEFLDGAEIAVECDPRTLSREMIDTLAREGTTRVSFGVQEFDPKVQRAINRVQPPEVVARAVERFREAGVASVNFDLIYGLPHQSVLTLVRTIELVKDMAPDRVALFGYAHVPWMAKRQRLIPEDALPNGPARVAQADAAAQALQAAGYETIGLDHFAQPGDGLSIAAREGRLARNFQGYTDDPARTLIGLGATSIGTSPNGYVQNIAETGAWSRTIANGDLPVAKGLAVSPDDLLRRDVIERVMCDTQINLDQIGANHDAPAGWWMDERERLRAMERDGLLRLDSSGFTLTTMGMPLRRVIAAVFDAYLPSSAARHSRTV